MIRPVALLANVRVGFEALRIHPMRTMLSVLGITIGCASLIATMAVSDGMLAFARDTIRRQTSVQVLAIAPRRAVFRDGQWMPVRDYPRFGAGDLESLRARLGPGVAATLTLGGGSIARHAGVRHAVHVSLGDAALPDFGGIDLGAGRFFAEFESARNAPVVLVNHALARAFAPGRDPYGLVGREIHVGSHRRRVIGVLAPGPFEDRENPSFAVIAPITAARALLEPPADGRFAPTLLVLAPSLEAVTEVQGTIEDWASRRWPRWRETVNVSVRLEQLTQVEQSMLLVKLFMGALVGISLLVGGIGIMNVLLASVAERTREIGIRKSVGARAGDIQLQFLTEAVAIALVGAAAGVVLGFAIALGVTAAFRALADVPVQAVLSVGSVLIATLASSAVGLAFGTYPARRAARLSPVLAIAQE